MIKPLNTGRNRDLGLLDFEGEVLFVKNGIVHFKLKSADGFAFLKCEKGYFKINFKCDQSLEEDEKGAVKNDGNVYNDYAVIKKIILVKNKK